mmetsp:Transcript_2922/g.4288  ORF Transcript_2922/g.4288 Transcript_2922/m.4288 type:complete len:92 (-) Transcript_2922:1084-1359(-)
MNCLRKMNNVEYIYEEIPDHDSTASIISRRFFPSLNGVNRGQGLDTSEGSFSRQLGVLGRGDVNIFTFSSHGVLDAIPKSVAGLGAHPGEN